MTISTTKKTQTRQRKKHPATFRRLAYDWIKSRGIDLNQVEKLTVSELKGLMENWSDFHKKNSVLQIVSESQNKHLWLQKRSEDIHYSKFYLDTN